MTIKEILLSGGKITHSYKEKKNDYIGEASIHIFEGLSTVLKKLNIFIQSLIYNKNKLFFV